MRIAIAGGGPGGLFAALALSHGGHAVTIFEQASERTELGAGIQLSPNGTLLLESYGVLEPIRDRSFEPQSAVLMRSDTGGQVLRTPLGAAAEHRYGAPYLHVHRGDLVDVLRDAATARGVVVRNGVEVTGYLEQAEAISVHLAGREPESFDLLVGADGIHSAVRTQLLGPDEARFTGNVAWRGLVRATDELRDLIQPDATVWAGAGRHFVHYYVRGGDLINFVAVEEREVWTEENWRVFGDLNEVRRAFGQWSSGIGALLEAADACHLWGLFDRAPLPMWHGARVALLGDACHSMLPFMAQGAVMSFEDAVVLAQELNSDGEVEAALARYELRRKARTSRVQERARRNASLFHQRSGLIRALTLTPLSIAGRLLPEFISRQLDWIYDHDARVVDEAIKR